MIIITFINLFKGFSDACGLYLKVETRRGVLLESFGAGKRGSVLLSGTFAGETRVRW